MASKEEQALLRKAARELRLLNDGLHRLREGKAPTKAQLPFVQQWIINRDAGTRTLKRLADDLRAEKDVAEWHNRILIPQWNAMIQVIREFGIETFSRSEDNHEWQGKVGEIKGHGDGYASTADALRAAIAWRLEQAMLGPTITLYLNSPSGWEPPKQA